MPSSITSGILLSMTRAAIEKRLARYGCTLRKRRGVDLYDVIHVATGGVVASHPLVVIARGLR